MSIRRRTKRNFLQSPEAFRHLKKGAGVYKSESDEQKLVYGIVYEPDVPDAHGDYMTAEEIEKAAHGFGGRPQHRYKS